MLCAGGRVKVCQAPGQGSAQLSPRKALLPWGPPSGEPAPGDGGFLLREVCELKSDAPDRFAWRGTERGMVLWEAPEAREACPGQRRLSPGSERLGLVGQRPGNMWTAPRLRPVCIEPWVSSEAHGDSHPQGDTQRGSDTLPGRHLGFL